MTSHGFKIKIGDGDIVNEDNLNNIFIQIIF